MRHHALALKASCTPCQQTAALSLQMQEQLFLAKRKLTQQEAQDLHKVSNIAAKLSCPASVAMLWLTLSPRHASCSSYADVAAIT